MVDVDMIIVVLTNVDNNHEHDTSLVTRDQAGECVVSVL